MAKIHFHPEASSTAMTLMGETPLHKTNTDGMYGVDCMSDWDSVDCKICLRKKPAPADTYMVRSNSLEFMETRKAGISEAGFDTSEISEEAGNTGGPTVYVFHWDSTKGDPQKLTRGDDRWSIANTFFQRAAHAGGWESAAARLANDWTAFGYRSYSLVDYISR